MQLSRSEQGLKKGLNQARGSQQDHTAPRKDMAQAANTCRLGQTDEFIYSNDSVKSSP